MSAVKKIIAAAVCVSVAAAGTVGGVMMYRSNRAQSNKVKVIHVSDIMDTYWGDELQLDGMVAASNSQSVVLSDSLLVEKVFVKEGEEVKKGTPLLEYDMTAVELDAAQKKTALAVAEDNVRQAQRELERIKALRPSEEAPVIPDYPFFPDEPVNPDAPVKTLAEVSDISQSAEGDGSDKSPYQFACTGNTIVRAAVLEQIRANGKCAVFVVYDANGYAAYAWLVSAQSLEGCVLSDWVLGANVRLTEDGGVQIKGGGIWYGIIQVGGTFDYDPAGTGEEKPSETENTEPTEEPSEQTVPVPDELPTETDIAPVSFIQPLSAIIPLAASGDGENYMYSRSELKYKISEQEMNIRSLEIQQKKAQIEYDSALKKKNDPVEKAKLDGVVTQLAESAEDVEVGKPFLIVQGEGGVVIEGSIFENYLSELHEGSVINVNSWETGEMVTATVTEVGDVPVSYAPQYYGQNPNNSMYPFRASVNESCSLTEGNYVSVTYSGESESNNFYIPVSYVRSENGRYYVLKKSDDGTLEKQFIQTGKIIYGGYSIEIISGIDESDSICFPYGKYVTEGALTEDSSPSYY